MWGGKERNGACKCQGFLSNAKLHFCQPDSMMLMSAALPPQPLSSLFHPPGRGSMGGRGGLQGAPLVRSREAKRGGGPDTKHLRAGKMGVPSSRWGATVRLVPMMLAQPPKLVSSPPLAWHNQPGREGAWEPCQPAAPPPTAASFFLSSCRLRSPLPLSLSPPPNLEKLL